MLPDYTHQRGGSLSCKARREEVMDRPPTACGPVPMPELPIGRTGAYERGPHPFWRK